MVLDYHGTTFRLLRREPVVSRVAERRLAAVERTLRVEVPAAVREWYALEGAVDQLDLQDGDLCFEPFGIDQNAKLLKEVPRRPPYTWVVGAYASGVWFGLSFPPAPDPVVHCLEPDGSTSDGGDEWSERPFSAFVFTCCWHKAREGAASTARVAPAFNPDHLRLLADRFDAGPHVRRGDYPVEVTNPFTGQGRLPVNRFRYFFFGTDGLIQVVAQDDPAVAATRAVLELTSPDEAGLRSLAKRLREAGILP